MRDPFAVNATLGKNWSRAVSSLTRVGADHEVPPLVERTEKMSPLSAARAGVWIVVVYNHDVPVGGIDCCLRERVRAQASIEREGRR